MWDVKNAESSQGNTSDTTQEEPVHKRRKLLSSYLRASEKTV